MIDTTHLTEEERQYLTQWTRNLESGETAQVLELIAECSISFQFAKTHSTYLKDWERMRAEWEGALKNGHLPEGISPGLFRAMIDASEEVMQNKLRMVRNAFGHKFGESIYNYLGPDGKTRKIFGLFG